MVSHPSNGVPDICRIYAKVHLKLFWLVVAQRSIKTLLRFPSFSVWFYVPMSTIVIPLFSVHINVKVAVLAKKLDYMRSVQALI